MRFWLYIEGIENKFLILGLYMAKLELVNPPKAWSSFKDQTKTSLLKSRSFDFLPAFRHKNAQQNNLSSANISTNAAMHCIVDGTALEYSVRSYGGRI